jgi:hypothetical protein
MRVGCVDFGYTNRVLIGAAQSEINTKMATAGKGIGKQKISQSSKLKMDHFLVQIVFLTEDLHGF